MSFGIIYLYYLTKRRGYMKKFFLFLMTTFTILFCSCTIGLDNDDDDVSLKFDNSTLEISIGEMDIVNLSVSDNQNSRSIEWSYDNSIISAKTDNYSAVITGLSAGKTTLTARTGGSYISCVVTVNSDVYAAQISDPYVYCSQDVIKVKTGETTKISASLFCGGMSDINGYKWNIDKTGIASISTNGNYCWITGRSSGIARLTINHTKAAHSFTALVISESDGTAVPYITSSYNVVSLDLDDSSKNSKTISFSMVNPLSSDYASGFMYDFVDENGTALSDSPVVIDNVNNGAVSITAKNEGSCYLKVSHNDCEYDFLCLIRVIKQGATAYIVPSETFVTVTGSETSTVSVSLSENIESIDNSLFTWEFSANAENYCSWILYNGNADNSGSAIEFVGKKAGSIKATVSYPGYSSRTIIVSIQDIESTASSATTYVSTSQNYVSLTPSSDDATVTVTLNDCDSGDINNLVWSVINSPSDGSSDDVIDFDVSAGSKKSSARSAFALTNNESATCVITPLKVGQAYIDITHPKAMYPTRITVSVKEKTNAVEVSYISASSSPAIYILNSGSDSESVGTASVTINGSGSEDDISWKIDNSIFTITANGTECYINPLDSGSGVKKATLTATLGTSNVEFAIVTYDTTEELSENIVNTIWTQTSYYSLEKDSEYTFNLQSSKSDLTTSDINWSYDNYKNEVYEIISQDVYSITVKGIAAGTSVITCTPSASSGIIGNVTFTINVYDAAIINPEESCYLSTTSNVVYFEDSSESKTIYITYNNIYASAYSETKWSLDNEDYYEIVPNGNSAVITPKTDIGSAILTVEHPASENSLTINLKTGNNTVYDNVDVCYISTSDDTLELLAGQAEVMISAKVNHTVNDETVDENSGFVWESSDSKVATLNYIQGASTCFVKPLKSGVCKITVSKTSSDPNTEIYSHDVMVVVTEADMDSVPYITSENNIVTLVNGTSQTINCKLVNSENLSSSKWNWKSSDSTIAAITSSSGGTAIIKGYNTGVCDITVTHDDSPFELVITTIVIGTSTSSSNQYITVSNNILNLSKNDSTEITASIAGMSEKDKQKFVWTSSDVSVALASGSGDSCVIKAMSSGSCYISVKNTNYSSAYERTILVIVSYDYDEDVYIQPSQNIIKISPEETTQVQVTAELVNGEATDAEDFTWFVDDPQMLSFVSNADTCDIIPTGKSGTTYLHVTHPKAKDTCDIVVVISKYDSFAFSNPSATVYVGDINFFDIQVPSLESEAEIIYSVSNEDVCTYQGSNEVCVFSGLKTAIITLTADLVYSSNPTTVIATDTMFISVEERDPLLPTISTAGVLYNVTEGDTVTISCNLSGSGFDEEDVQGCRWYMESVGDAEASFHNETVLNETTNDKNYRLNENFVRGGSCEFEGVKAGEVKIIICHYDSGVEKTILLSIAEQKEKQIIFPQSYMEIYMDDGSQEIELETVNITSEQKDKIKWTASKSGGSNIVDIASASGTTAKVTPKNAGTTIITATFENSSTGETVMGFCTIVVKRSAELTFDVGAIHVLPQQTKVINYTVYPENASVNLLFNYNQAALQYLSSDSSSSNSSKSAFSYSINQAAHTISITGLNEYPSDKVATASGYITSGVRTSLGETPTFDIYVEYDMDLQVNDAETHNSINNTTVYPEIKKVIRTIDGIKYSPDTFQDYDFEIIYKPGDENAVECVIDIPNAGSENQVCYISNREVLHYDGIEYAIEHVKLSPTLEGEVEITVTLNLLSEKEKGLSDHSLSQKFKYQAYYDNYTIRQLTDIEDTGKYTNASQGNINLGDGETVLLSFDIVNPYVASSQSENIVATYTAGNTSSSDMASTSEKKFLTMSRNDLRKEFFETEKADNINKYLDNTSTDYNDTNYNLLKNFTNSNTDGIGEVKDNARLMYFAKEDGINYSGKSVYRLQHLWDYYKELPKEIYDLYTFSSGESEDNYRNNHDKTYKFLTYYYKNIDYFLISKDFKVLGKNPENYKQMFIQYHLNGHNLGETQYENIGEVDNTEGYNYGALSCLKGYKYPNPFYLRKNIYTNSHFIEDRGDGGWISMSVDGTEFNIARRPGKANSSEPTFYFPAYKKYNVKDSLNNSIANGFYGELMNTGNFKTISLDNPYVLSKSVMFQNPFYFSPYLNCYSEHYSDRHTPAEEHHVNWYTFFPSVIHPYAKPWYSVDATERGTGTAQIDVEYKLANPAKTDKIKIENAIAIKLTKRNCRMDNIYSEKNVSSSSSSSNYSYLMFDRTEKLLYTDVSNYNDCVLNCYTNIKGTPTISVTYENESESGGIETTLYNSYLYVKAKKTCTATIKISLNGISSECKVTVRSYPKLVLSTLEDDDSTTTVDNIQLIQNTADTKKYIITSEDEDFTINSFTFSNSCSNHYSCTEYTENYTNEDGESYEYKYYQFTGKDSVGTCGVNFNVNALLGYADDSITTTYNLSQSFSVTVSAPSTE